MNAWANICSRLLRLYNLRLYEKNSLLMKCFKTHRDYFCENFVCISHAINGWKKGGGLLWDASLSPGNSIVRDGFVLWNVRHKVVFIRMDIYSNGFVLCVCVRFQLLCFNTNRWVEHRSRDENAPIVCVTHLPPKDSPSYTIQRNKFEPKTCFLKACVVLAWQVFFSPRNKIVQQMWKPEMI